MVQFNEILGNKKIVRILHFFINNPSIEISQTELISKLKIAKATGVKWLGFLIQTNLLFSKRIGVTNIYRLNNEHIIIKNLKLLNTLFLLQDMEKLKEKNIEIYLYGSAARGEERESSDVDILFIGELKRTDIIGFIEKLSGKIKKRINFNIFNPIEWSMMEKKDKPYFERVEKDKVRLI